MNIYIAILIISVSFNIFMFFYLKWYVKRRTSVSYIDPEKRTEILRMIADLDEATDRDSLLVGQRIKELNEILDDTDKRISVYVKELERSRTGEALYTNLGRGIRAALKTETEKEIKPPEAQVIETPPPAVQKTETLPPKILPDMELFTSPPEKPPLQTKQKTPSKQIRTFIDQLLSEGLPPEEIASRLEISVAAVYFAMNFQKKKVNPA